jgi:hypothetical protein
MVQPYMDSDWAIFAPKQIPVYPNANENISYGNMFFYVKPEL